MPHFFAAKLPTRQLRGLALRVRSSNGSQRHALQASTPAKGATLQQAQEDLAAVERLELKLQQLSERHGTHQEKLGGALAAMGRQLKEDGVLGAEDPAASDGADGPLPSLADVLAAMQATNAEAKRVADMCAARDKAAEDWLQDHLKWQQEQQERLKQLKLEWASGGSSPQPTQAVPASSVAAAVQDIAQQQAAQARQEQAAQPVAHHPSATEMASPVPAVTEVTEESTSVTEESSSVTEESSSVTDEPTSAPAHQAATAESSQPRHMAIKVQVAVQCPTRPGEDLVLAGSHPALGSWQLANALRMKWTSDSWWRAEFEVPVDTSRLEFKAVLLARGRATWEAGPNNVLELTDTPSASSSHVFAK